MGNHSTHGFCRSANIWRSQIVDQIQVPTHPEISLKIRSQGLYQRNYFFFPNEKAKGWYFWRYLEIFEILIRINLWLVVYLPLWKIWKSIGMMTFPIYGNSCLFPSTQAANSPAQAQAQVSIQGLAKWRFSFDLALKVWIASPGRCPNIEMMINFCLYTMMCFVVTCSYP